MDRLKSATIFTLFITTMTITLNFIVFNAAGSVGNPPGLLVSSLSGEAELAAVPIPAAVWLFGSGLLGLIGVARRK